MKKRFMDFMSGRYGADQLSKFLLGVCLVCLILNMVTRQPVVYVLALVILGICYFRMFSRNTYKRSEENRKYLEMTARVRNYFARIRRRIADSKDYHIYKCPSCKQKIRIPRGKGKICITCPKCRTEFEKKS
ncbi:MAG: hypothetical protein SOX32_00645 [Candidatus Choladocola sp.]|nr:hypothetical protein [Candidatus Choladocola sp.]